MPTMPSRSLPNLLKMFELDGVLGSHDPRPSNTMMSPRWMPRKS